MQVFTQNNAPSRVTFFFFVLEHQIPWYCKALNTGDTLALNTGDTLALNTGDTLLNLLVFPNVHN